LIQWLIETTRFEKHHSEVSDTTNIPIIQWLIEVLGFTKHIAHLSDITDMPAVQWLIEPYSHIKHVGHVSDIGSVPVLNVVFKVITSLEQSTHVLYTGSGPSGDMSIFDQSFLTIFGPHLHCLSDGNVIQRVIGEDDRPQFGGNITAVTVDINCKGGVHIFLSE
jgi:hypothetical protein